MYIYGKGIEREEYVIKMYQRVAAIGWKQLYRLISESALGS